MLRRIGLRDLPKVPIYESHKKMRDRFFFDTSIGIGGNGTALVVVLMLTPMTNNLSVALRALQTSNGPQGPLELVARALIRSRSRLRPHARSWEQFSKRAQES